MSEFTPAVEATGTSGAEDGVSVLTATEVAEIEERLELHGIPQFTGTTLARLDTAWLADYTHDELIIELSLGYDVRVPADWPDTWLRHLLTYMELRDGIPDRDVTGKVAEAATAHDADGNPLTPEQQLAMLVHSTGGKVLHVSAYMASVKRAVAEAPSEVEAARVVAAAARETGLPFENVQALLGDEPDIQWTWKHYIAPGAKSLLTSRPKVGKSTTVTGLVAALRRGDAEFCGLPIGQNVGVLYCTEESSKAALRTKVQAAGIDFTDEGLRFLRRVQVHGQEWEDIVPELHEYACRFRDEGGFDVVLIVIDTLAKWAGLEGEQENQSGYARDAIAALDPIAADDFAILIVHHAGWRSDRSRGSTALVGEVDVCLFLDGEPGKSSTRTLRYQGGRLDTGDTPEAINIAYDPEHHIAAFATGARQASADAWFDTLEAVKLMDPENSGVTTEQVADQIDRSRPTAWRHLKKLVELGHMVHVQRETAQGRESYYRIAGTSRWSDVAALVESGLLPPEAQQGP